MEQGNNGDRAATSVVPEVMCFRADCTSDTVKPLCGLSGVPGSLHLEAGDPVVVEDYKGDRVLLLSKVRERES